MDIDQRKNTAFFVLAAVLLLASLLIPTSVIREMKIYQCTECGALEILSIYTYGFWHLIPDISHISKYNYSNKKILQINHKHHKWIVPIDHTYSGTNLIDDKYRYFSFVLVFLMFFNRFIIRRHLANIDILNAILKYKGLFRVFSLMLFLLVFLMILIVLLSFMSQFKNSSIPMLKLYKQVQNAQVPGDTQNIEKLMEKFGGNPSDSGNTADPGTLLKKFNPGASGNGSSSSSSSEESPSFLQNLELQSYGSASTGDSFDNSDNSNDYSNNVLNNSSFNGLRSPENAGFLKGLLNNLLFFRERAEEKKKDYEYLNSLLDIQEGREE
ncbi:MAG: hypothetical protein ABIH89_02440 [Elusimicrobiota bacterium]